MFTKKVYITYTDLEKLANKSKPVWDTHCGLYRVVSHIMGGYSIDSDIIYNEEDFNRVAKNRFCVYKFSLFSWRK